MSKNINIAVEYLTRVEGHGNIVVNVKNGTVEKCEFNVVEAPRFFEGMLRGRSVFEAQHITSRICGICACGHSLASIAAAEDALGFKPSKQTIELRKFLLHMENLDSHILHIYLLAAPDILNVPSFAPLIKTHGEVVKRALRMKRICNEICDIFVGRHIHPISAIVGGFTKLPKPKDIETMLAKLKELAEDMKPTVEFCSTLKFPKFERKTEYVGLVSDDKEYPLLIGDVGSSEGKRVNKNDYKELLTEYVDPRSSAKFAKAVAPSYAAGALSRVNLNFDKLTPNAKKLATALGLKPLITNPYLNTAAQLVECVHCLEEATRILTEFKDGGINHDEQVIVGINEKGTIPVKAGRGVGAVEVPRGILIHDYEIDDKGMILSANCMIPTNQNVANIQYDMQELVKQVIDKPEKEITLAMEMLVRAYDPCISCSAHLLDVEFVNK